MNENKESRKRRTMNSQNDEIEIDLREIIAVLWRRFPIILAVTAVFGIIAGLISNYALTPMYTSTAKIYILTSQSSMVSLSDLQLGSSLANDYEELIKSRPVAESVVKGLKLDMTYQELLEHVEVTNPDNTRIIRIQITYPDPVIAKDIANRFVEVSKKQLSEIMHIDEPTVAEEAVAAKTQSSPDNMKNIFIGALIGLLLSAGVFIAGHVMDDTVKNAEDVEKLLGLNVLAAVPEEGGTDNSEKKQKRSHVLRGIRKGENK